METRRRLLSTTWMSWERLQPLISITVTKLSLRRSNFKNQDWTAGKVFSVLTLCSLKRVSVRLLYSRRIFCHLLVQKSSFSACLKSCWAILTAQKTKELYLNDARILLLKTWALYVLHEYSSIACTLCLNDEFVLKNCAVFRALLSLNFLWLPKTLWLRLWCVVYGTTCRTDYLRKNREREEKVSQYLSKKCSKSLGQSIEKQITWKNDCLLPLWEEGI